MTTTKPKIVVFCELLDNESFCASVVRELERSYRVLPCGPGWGVEDPLDYDLDGVRFYLELDSASGAFPAPRDRLAIPCPRFAWLVDTHKKPDFHRQLSQQVDLCFFAMARWGHVLAEPRVWLPLHADPGLFFPQERERDLDLVFVGSQPWRADPLRRIAERHGLSLEVACTSGPREKTETADLYARAKLVFNRHVTNDLNFRVFEAMACGRVLLTDAQDNGQYELLRDGEHALLYKDEADLERLVLELLADPERRSRIEAAATAHFAQHHTTRARVDQLVGQVEQLLAAREGAGTGGGASAELLAPPAPSVRLLPPLEAPALEQARVAVVSVGPRPPSVSGLRYAERIADGLAAAGVDVHLLHAGRVAEGAATRIPLEAGALPSASTPTSHELLSATPGLVQLEALLAEGEWDAVVGGGPFGALIGQPVAARLGIPFVAALERCEVTLRGNRLTRDQLYRAELEHWACERAARVWCSTRADADAVRRHYRAARVDCVSAPAPPVEPCPDDAARLAALLPGAARWLWLAPDDASGPGVAETAPPGWLVLGADAWLSTPGGPRQLARDRVHGAALAALLATCEGVVAAPGDPRRGEARALGKPVLAPSASVPGPEAFAAAPAAQAGSTPAEALQAVLSAQRSEVA